MESKDKRIIRSRLFIVAHQLEGVCTGLRLAISVGRSPAQGTLTILGKLRKELPDIIDPRTFDALPEIGSLSEAVDILVYAEMLRASVVVFLTPQEVEEHQKTIGFR